VCCSTGCDADGVCPDMPLFDAGANG
jgi:hypothetical protein